MMNLSNSICGTSAFASGCIPKKCLWPFYGMILIPVTAERLPVALNVKALNS